MSGASSVVTQFRMREGEMRSRWAVRSTPGKATIVTALVVVGALVTGSCSPPPTTSTNATSTAPVAAVSSAPTTPATLTPPRAPTPFHFGTGQRSVGTDLQAGTYRTRLASAACYWARLSGFGGTVNEILANENADGPTIVTILTTDKGFESTRCAEWTVDLSAITKSTTDPFPEGTYLIGVDIAPGTWHNSGGAGCYWQRMSGFTGSLNEIVANGNVDGPVNVTLAATDKGFKSTRCGTWTRVG